MDENAADAVLLLVSELVTNAILHGGATAADALSLELSVLPDAIRVEVHDPGGGDVVSGAADPDREGGWGLVLLDSIADRWGVESEPEHAVWFELDRQSDGASPDA